MFSGTNLRLRKIACKITYQKIDPVYLISQNNLDMQGGLNFWYVILQAIFRSLRFVPQKEIKNTNKSEQLEHAGGIEFLVC